MAEKKPLKFYVVNQSKYSLSRPRTGKDGKPMVAKNAKGEERELVNGDPVYVMRDITFQTVIGDSRIGRKLCVYEATDEWEAEVLKKEAADPGSQIMDEATFKKTTNEKAWDQEQRALKAEEDARAMAAALEGSETRNQKLEAEIAKLREELKGKK